MLNRNYTNNIVYNNPRQLEYLSECDELEEYIKIIE